MVRTYAGIPGKTLMDAIELANETFGIKAPEGTATTTEARNDASLQQLNSLLAGVK